MAQAAVSALAIVGSRTRIRPFALHRPATIAAACDVLANHPESSVVHAGGIDLCNRLKLGAPIRHLVAVDRVAELSGIRVTADHIDIGAATRLRAIECDALLAEVLPSLPQYVAGVANVRVRSQGTLGGNILSGETAYEMLPMAALLDAYLEGVDPASGRLTALPASRLLKVCDDSSSTSDAALPIEQARRALGLLVRVRIPRRARTVVWNRDGRPSLGFLCGVEGWPGGAGAVRVLTIDGAGGPVLTVLPVPASPPRATTGGTVMPRSDAPVGALAARWMAAQADLAEGPFKGDMLVRRRMAAALLRRALESIGSAPSFAGVR